jgi:hypothetical protein
MNDAGDACDDVDDDHDELNNITSKRSSDSSWSPEGGDWSSSAPVSPAWEADALFQGGQMIDDGTSSSAVVAAETTTDTTAGIAAIGSSSAGKPGAIDDESLGNSSSYWSSSNAADTTTTRTTTPSETQTAAKPGFQRGQHIFVAIGKADHVAKFDSFIHDEKTNRPLLAKVRYTSSLMWDHVEIDQLKPMHIEKDGELITSSYSKRMRQETNRYNPSMGGGNDAATESAAAPVSDATALSPATSSRARRSGHELSSKSTHGEKNGGLVSLPTASPYSKRTRRETNRYQPLMGKGSSDGDIVPVAPKVNSREGRRLEPIAMQGMKNKERKGQEADGNGKNCQGAKRHKGNKEEEEGDGGGKINNDDEGDVVPTHGYYEVDEILDRRMKKVGSDINGVGMRFIVEYREWSVRC